MKYKEQILQKIESIENQLKYVEKALTTQNMSANEIVAILSQNLRKLESIKSFIEAE
jgi:uncharacterized Fe-S cluster-containing protein